MQYFHRLLLEDYTQAMRQQVTPDGLIGKYNKPYWCEHIDPLNGITGCHRLLTRDVTRIDHCSICTFNIEWVQDIKIAGYEVVLNKEKTQ